MDDRCSIRRCQGGVDVIYLDHGVCAHHWNELTAEGKSPDELRMGLGIEATEPTAMEVDMAEKKTEKVRATKKTKAEKVPKPKKERPPKEDLMVFAFRLSKTESEALHKAAGPANASRTMRSLAAAFAAEDPDAFKAVVAEARKLRA